MTRLSEATRIASTTAIIYFLVSSLWILLSDKLLAVIVHNFADLQEFQTYKGWFFVSVTSLLLYSTLRVHIAKRRELEGQLLRAQRMENLGRLAGGIAHDLNNILGPVLLGSEVLVKSVQDERSRKMLDVITKSVERGRALVRQILTFSRGMDDELAEVSFKYIAKEVTELLSHALPPSITIRSEIPSDLGTLRADPGQINQVLMNLAVNAKDAMPNGGELTIKAQNIDVADKSPLTEHLLSGPYVEINVSDTGMGIPPEHLEAIFHPFFTTKETGKGTGLGLSIVHSIVKNHGGHVMVESTVSKGTTFHILLPASRGTKAISTKAIQTVLAVGRGEKILIVDDEDSVRDIMKEALESQGYRVLTARDGAEALAVVAKNKGEISVIITDLLMPVMGGASFVRGLHSMRVTLPVIVTSGTHDRSEARQSLEGLEYFATLEKPFSVDSLFKTIEAALAGNQQWGGIK